MDRTARVEGPCPRLAVVVSRFHEHITQLLLEGAGAALRAAYEPASYDIYWVPGAFEIPQMLRRVAALRNSAGDGPRYRGLLTLGCLIKGDTDHYEYIAAEVTRGIGAVALEAEVPVCHGVLTCQTMQQAMHRALPGELNKGAEVMDALLEMVANWDLLAGR